MSGIVDLGGLIEFKLIKYNHNLNDDSEELQSDELADVADWCSVWYISEGWMMVTNWTIITHYQMTFTLNATEEDD